MAEIKRKTKGYPTDLTDEEWSRIEPLLPRPSKTGDDGEAICARF
ncbi:MAG: transposase [Alphaproteobacteria bacterium]|nr:transposase [Alphaproteobacteria bacterium]